MPARQCFITTWPHKGGQVVSLGLHIIHGNVYLDYMIFLFGFFYQERGILILRDIYEQETNALKNLQIDILNKIIA